MRNFITHSLLPFVSLILLVSLSAASAHAQGAPASDCSSDALLQAYKDLRTASIRGQAIRETMLTYTYEMRKPEITPEVREKMQTAVSNLAVKGFPIQQDEIKLERKLNECGQNLEDIGSIAAPYFMK